jgi:hypothetical protein
MANLLRQENDMGQERCCWRVDRQRRQSLDAPQSWPEARSVDPAPPPLSPAAPFCRKSVTA